MGFTVVALCALTAGSVGVADEPSVSEALGLLKALEKTRTSFKPFRLNGTLRRPFLNADDKTTFRVDCEDAKYRVTSLGSRRRVAVYDGEQLLTYDGQQNAAIMKPEERSSSALAFDPRTLGFSTGLYSDLTLKENLAYHSAKDTVIVDIPPGRRQSGLVGVELTDRFAQRIRFEVENHAPYRVHYYSKTISRKDGKGIFATYTTTTEYWPEQSENWIPKKLTAFTQYGDDDQKVVESVVEFERPEFVSEIAPSTWTIAGLSLPFGEPVVDLRIKQRIGYWNGAELVEQVPVRK
ncbi:MAG: hypothetical protein V4719_08800 [Planctomycetota bacterium]